MPTSAGGTPDAAREAHGRPGRQQHRARRHDGTQALRGFVPRATEWDDWRGKVDALQKEKWAIDGTADGTKPTPVVEEPYWGEALTNYSEVTYDNSRGGTRADGERDREAVAAPPATLTHEETPPRGLTEQ